MIDNDPLSNLSSAAIQSQPDSANRSTLIYRIASRIFAIGGVVALASGFILYWYFLGSGGVSHESRDWAEFGEFITGFSGTAIALAALIALAYTIRMQADDLADSRRHMQMQIAAMERQAATMAHQAFDTTFFNLLKRFSDVRDNVSYNYRTTETGDPHVKQLKKRASGVEAFEKLYSDMSATGEWEVDHPDRREFVREHFDSYYKFSESQLGPYFRTLYHIFKFIEDAPSSLLDEEKSRYASMARAQLSDSELCVLFYDGLTSRAEVRSTDQKVRNFEAC